MLIQLNGTSDRPLRNHQAQKQKDDLNKLEIAKKNGYELLAIWENDIYRTPELVKQIVSEVCL